MTLQFCCCESIAGDGCWFSCRFVCAVVFFLCVCVFRVFLWYVVQMFFGGLRFWVACALRFWVACACFAVLLVVLFRRRMDGFEWLALKRTGGEMRTRGAPPSSAFSIPRPHYIPWGFLWYGRLGGSPRHARALLAPDQASRKMAMFREGGVSCWCAIVVTCLWMDVQDLGSRRS